MHWLLMTGVLLGAPGIGSIDTGVFGVRLGAGADALREGFAPQGKVRGSAWSEDRPRPKGVSTLTFQCLARERCFTVPDAAEFYFVDGRLASASLHADTSHAPPGISAPRVMGQLLAELGWRRGAVVQRVGRRTRYFLRPGWTAVWVEDGPSIELKLYLDTLAPVGRAEAIAAGAPDEGLAGLKGARAYLRGHEAISAGRWGAAVEALEAVLAEKGVSPLLAGQAQLVLALALAARAKRGPRGDAWRRSARRDLRRALRLAPSLSADIEALAAELHLSLEPGASPADP